MTSTRTTTAAMHLYFSASTLHEKGLLAYWMTATETQSGKFHINALDEAVDHMEQRIKEYKAARANDIEPEEMEAAE